MAVEEPLSVEELCAAAFSTLEAHSQHKKTALAADSCRIMEGGIDMWGIEARRRRTRIRGGQTGWT
jgi:hypothetical protein